MTIKRLANGSWCYVASFKTEFEAECAVKGLNEHGQWEYKLFK